MGKNKIVKNEKLSKIFFMSLIFNVLIFIIH